MATIRAYTTIEQSRKLAEILPLESADMCYVIDYIESNKYNTDHFKLEVDTYGLEARKRDNVPCWSLSALLGVLPYCPDLSKHTDGKWYITTYPNDVHTCLMAYDNPVDACVAMIELLHEQNFI